MYGTADAWIKKNSLVQQMHGQKKKKKKNLVQADAWWIKKKCLVQADAWWIKKENVWYSRCIVDKKFCVGTTDAWWIKKKI
jgi:hypothetical protein